MNAIGNRRVDIQVPIELVDQSLSSDSVAKTFERTLTTFNTDHYDGAVVVYELEAVVSNSGSTLRNVRLVDEQLLDLKNELDVISTKSEGFKQWYSFGRSIDVEFREIERADKPPLQSILPDSAKPTDTPISAEVQVQSIPTTPSGPGAPPPSNATTHPKKEASKSL